MLPQSHDVLAVIRVPGINERFPSGLYTESDTRIRMNHGESLYIQTWIFQAALLDLIEENRVGLGFDPMAKNSPELLEEGSQAVRTDYPKGKRARKIDRVIHGEKKGHEIRNVVRVKMGEAEKINLAIIQAQPDHLPQRPTRAIKKNKVRIHRQRQSGGTPLDRRNASARSQNIEFHFLRGRRFSQRNALS